MRSLLFGGLVFVTASAAYSGTSEPPIADALKKWKTVRISLPIDNGDYHPEGPFILLQRLDRERIVLSTGKNRLYTAGLPVARTIISNDDAQRLLDRAVAFYARAQQETGEKARVDALPTAERGAVYKGRAFGIDAFYIRIEVMGEGRPREYQDDFAQGSAALEEFGNFIVEQCAP